VGDADLVVDVVLPPSYAECRRRPAVNTQISPGTGKASIAILTT
jgi:hypothetical protein